jgi:hypothetical protein
VPNVLEISDAGDISAPGLIARGLFRKPSSFCKVGRGGEDGPRRLRFAYSGRIGLLDRFVAAWLYVGLRVCASMLRRIVILANH